MDEKYYCRLCLQVTNNFLIIHLNEGKDLHIKKLIYQHLYFMVQENDEFSDKICAECWNKLNSFHDFYKQITKAQENINLFLKTKFDADQVKSEDVESTGDIKPSELKPECYLTDYISEDSDTNEKYPNFLVTEYQYTCTSPSKFNNGEDNSNIDNAEEQNMYEDSSLKNIDIVENHNKNKIGDIRPNEATNISKNQRGKYSRITRPQKELLVNFYNQGKSIIEAATMCSININTAKSIIRAYKANNGKLIEHPRGGNRPRKLTKQALTAIEKFVENKPSITLREIKRRLLQQNNIEISKSTIRKGITPRYIR